MRDGATVGAVLRDVRGRFAAAGIDTAGLDARLLVGHVLDLDATGMILADADPLEPDATARIEAVVARRLAGEPVGRILGRRAFYGLDLELSPATLEPRPDTETVVDAALERVPDVQAPLKILDVGTGTGAILLALLSQRPAAIGVGIDLSAEASATAARNADRLGLSGRALFCVGDLAAAASGPFDLVVSNPPYIESAEIDRLDLGVRAYDPRLALDGGPDGLAAYRRLVAQAAGLVAPAGALILEIGVGQAESVAMLCRAAGFDVAPPRVDMAGHARVLVATWP
ncbi:peptide chain release factor N(5)-glutamine methyltransferase [Amorphus orientalis]|uniref:Release factor glutamine methyltransferase n=1 Tax=Amorphus orientalis TaxID=649198 RepID=A0AAE3VL49_9HYPH|nr:peptide chain release factor N(5)-glutamine methyltransferase [Amorphus orientalis]MDQ0313913.1 release factor glutamine methyltransferase [Amorphus orientalis]